MTAAMQKPDERFSTKENGEVTSRDVMPVAPQRQTCQVQMYGGNICGRPTIDVSSNQDPSPVCVMHTRDWDKRGFDEECAQILEKAGDGVADFTGFIFVETDFLKRAFVARCVFNKATFQQDVDFSSTEFIRGADFGSARFNGHASFVRSIFGADSTFNGARFKLGADFTFAIFNGRIGFERTRFIETAEFSSVSFDGETSFVKSSFTQNAVFSDADFVRSVSFMQASFGEPAYFTQTVFHHDAVFVWTRFSKGAFFNGTNFAGMADFRRAAFLGPAEFRETHFRRDGTSACGPVFCLAQFSSPETVVFYRAYLGQALFHNCDVSKIAFSSVEWRTRPSNGKRMVFEEMVDLSIEIASALKVGEETTEIRDFGLIAELYQQLKKNYDDRKDYWTAGDFHFGEMEMKRLASGPPGPVVRAVLPKSLVYKKSITELRRWFHRRLSLVAWYRYASQYGESFGRPALWLFFSLLFFAALYPVAGLEYSSQDSLQISLTQEIPRAPAPKSSPLNQRDGAMPAANPEAEKESGPEIRSPGGIEPVSSTESDRSNAKPTQTIQRSPTTSRMPLTYWHPSIIENDGRPKWKADVLLFGNSVIAAIEIAAFQKDHEYSPAYPWGHVLGLLEMLLTSTLFALFLLAVRRQFRR
jgi:uncharacterized protein YjbI with pentapeptide repeats